jgi:hypothetical protein
MVRRGLVLALALMPSVAVAACDWFAYDDNSAPPTNGPEGGYDTTVPRDATGGIDSPRGAEDAGDALEEPTEGGSEDAADAAADAGGANEAGCSACACGCFDGSCTLPFNQLGPTTASANGSAVTLFMTSPNGASTQGGPVSHNDSLTVSTQTSPGGATQSVGLAYSTDPTVPPGSSSVVMQVSSSTSTADTWTGTIPAQAQGSEVYFYVFATPYNDAGCRPTAYDPSNFMHYAYAVN